MRPKAPIIITGVRLLLAPVLLLCEPLSAGFYTVYLLCGLSDMLDGAVARLTHSQSRTGAVLDSAADGVLLVFAAAALRGYIVRLPAFCLYSAAAVLLLRAAAAVAGAIRFKKPVFFHTASDKVIGFTLFCLPFFLGSRAVGAFLLVLCAAALLSALEELLCALLSREADPELRGVLFLLAGRDKRTKGSGDV